MKKKAFLCSTYAPGFHPFLTGTDKEITSILGETYDITVSDQFKDMTLAEMRQYDCLMFYSAPFWGLKGDCDFVANLLEYIVTGGSFMIMHIIATGAIPETAQVVGGGFRMHPPFNKYHFYPEPPCTHPILEGIEPFDLMDEMHQVYLEQSLNKTVLLCVNNNNGRPHDTGVIPHQDIYAKNSGNGVELAWCNEFGKGRIIYACPGHNAESYRNPMLRKFLANCGKWAAHEI